MGRKCGVAGESGRDPCPGFSLPSCLAPPNFLPRPPPPNPHPSPPTNPPPAFFAHLSAMQCITPAPPDQVVQSYILNLRSGLITNKQHPASTKLPNHQNVLRKISRLWGWGSFVVFSKPCFPITLLLFPFAAAVTVCCPPNYPWLLVSAVPYILAYFSSLPVRSIGPRMQFSLFV